MACEARLDLQSKSQSCILSSKDSVCNAQGVTG
jgi:hypothetical protein